MNLLDLEELPGPAAMRGVFGACQQAMQLATEHGLLAPWKGRL